MNWYKSNLFKFAQRGEWWINDSGQAMFADGDVGDMNHEAIAYDYIISMADLNPDQVTVYDLRSKKQEELVEMGFGPDEITVIYGRMDAREYGQKNLGWIRVVGNSVQTYSISNQIIKRMANGLWDAYDEEVEQYSFDIDVQSTGQMFQDVPFEILTHENLSELMIYTQSQDNYRGYNNRPK